MFRNGEKVGEIRQVGAVKLHRGSLNLLRAAGNAKALDLVTTASWPIRPSLQVG
jgi:hypothetical protein